MKLSQSLSKLYASRSNPDDPLETVQFSHPQFNNSIYTGQGNTWRFCNISEDTDFVLESGKTYQHIAASFEVGVPEQNGELQAAIAVQFGLVDRRMIDELNAALSNDPDTPISLVYRSYVGAKEYPGLTLSVRITDASVDSDRIVLSADRADFLNTRFPNLFFTAKTFPGIDR